MLLLFVSFLPFGVSGACRISCESMFWSVMYVVKCLRTYHDRHALFFVHLCTHTHTHAHALTHTYTRTHTHWHIHTHANTHTHTHTLTNTRTDTYTRTHTHWHIHTYTHKQILIHISDRPTEQVYAVRAGWVPPGCRDHFTWPHPHRCDQDHYARVRLQETGATTPRGSQQQRIGEYTYACIVHVCTYVILVWVSTFVNSNTLTTIKQTQRRRNT